MNTGSLPLDDFLAMVAQRFQALADPTRLRLLFELKKRGEMRVSDLVEKTSLPQPTVSKHLALLRTAHLVEFRREGTTIFYKLRGDAVSQLCETVCASLVSEHEARTRSLRQGTGTLRSPKRS